MKLIVDLEMLDSKDKLLNHFKNLFTEMYSTNYDAFIDVLTSFEAKLEITFEAYEAFSDLKNLEEISNIIIENNPNITIFWAK